METAIKTSKITIESCVDDHSQRTLADDVRIGLTQYQKQLPPKHAYDTLGSQLFDQICELPEYYPTKSEHHILVNNAKEIVDITSANTLTELGSGTAKKTRVLLDAMADASLLQHYVALEVSEQMVRDTANALIDEYPGLHVYGVIGDFERHLDRLPNKESSIIAFLGGTIGNFPPPARVQLLAEIGQLLGPNDYLLLGTDLVKDISTIELAYNDSAQVTAQFNRNILRVINSELDANFDLDNFEHIAFFNHEQEWIEMRLRAHQACTVNIAALDLMVEFAAGEDILTEISAKFTKERLEADYAAAGLQLKAWFTDSNDYFALSLAQRSGSLEPMHVM